MSESCHLPKIIQNVAVATYPSNYQIRHARSLFSINWKRRSGKVLFILSLLFAVSLSIETLLAGSTGGMSGDRKVSTSFIFNSILAVRESRSATNCMRMNDAVVDIDSSITNQAVRKTIIHCMNIWPYTHQYRYVYSGIICTIHCTLMVNNKLHQS